MAKYRHRAAISPQIFWISARCMLLDLWVGPSSNSESCSPWLGSSLWGFILSESSFLFIISDSDIKLDNISLISVNSMTVEQWKISFHSVLFLSQCFHQYNSLKLCGFSMNLIEFHSARQTYSYRSVQYYPFSTLDYLWVCWGQPLLRYLEALYCPTKRTCKASL